ncbi:MULTISPECIES: orotidine-5'-phosphate decarboxylase [Providencia]|uniref:orotidine-5'-phosphate decarboxylase n=1 Tax=Providencia TaxID=586 RepID=UPI00083941A2|nr:orotidine-5'-phosphate decarboxylase [Providencia heimbachae]MBP6121474.1 orotidine-5'-phosphate decarboxylase [Providencia sp.]MDD9338087.1 orotidine-5'-phosphate decarboxylase [Providencia heimbachae]NIH22662.1 orotidine-5'-phosphate decarboxylase [Providencia heimbachae]
MISSTENQTRVTTHSPVIVALDYDNANDALAFVDRIDPRDCRLKVGKEMFTFNGPQFVKSLHQRGFDVFLDLKFHDIPNTVARAVAASAEMGVWMVNVHAGGGARMMEAARQALEAYGKDAPLLTAVTVLTSMDESDLIGVGIDVSPAVHAKRLALLTKACGLDGVVCSAHEAESLKIACGADFKLVTPGIRPVGSDVGDQRRIMTPQDAVKAGVDYMVIGRPITRSDNPTLTLQQINQSIKDLV